MQWFKERAAKIKESSAQNTYDSLCYLLCCILLVVFIIALLIIPFASISNGETAERSAKDTQGDRSTEKESEITSADISTPAGVVDTEKSLEISGSEVIFPLDGKITSNYGWRDSPVSASSEYTFHYGIDISASISDVILSYKSGTVTETGYSDSYGYYILISHGDHDSFYAHCDKIYVSAGDIVECEEIIAKAGDTGRATGKHLHFEIRINGTAVDPLQYVTPNEDQT